MRYQTAVGDSGIERATLTLAGLTSAGERGTVGWGSLDGLTLSPAPGKLTVLLGLPGSGKSALIRALAGFARVGGTMTLDGRSIAHLPAWRRGFGVMLQPDALIPHLTLADNVAFGLRQRGVRRASRRAQVEEALHLVQLDGLGERRPDAVTAAQRQRAMLARATVFAPRVLLLDEPACAQDQPGRAALLASLPRIHALLGGATTWLATCSGADALAVADQVAVLRAGAIEQHGPAEEVFHRPRNDYVAALLGEVNRLAGTIVALDDEVATVRLACGPVIEAQPGRALEAGDACVVSLRPDRIAVAAASAAEMGADAVDATLIDAQFQGDSYRLLLLIGSGAQIVVRRPAAAGLRGLTVGGTAALAWQPHHAFAFRAARPGPAQGLIAASS